MMPSSSTSSRTGLLGLLDPSAVTIVGASPDSFFASALLDNLTTSDFPFAGDINLVSRSRTEVAGRRCVPSLADVESPGLIYLLVGAAQCLPVLQQARGQIEGVVVITSDLGAEIEVGLVDWAREHDVPLLGPNCMGLFSLGTGFFGYAGPLAEFRTGRVGLVMQSGGMLSGIVGALASRGLGVATAVSFGNAVSLDFLELTLPLLDDEGIETVLVYAESIRDVRDLRVLGAAAGIRGKHVVLVQGGQSEAGAEAARSHTGMLATSSRVVAGVARQAGIIACTDLEEAVWAIEALATPGLPEPRRGGVAVLSSSGGGAVAMADAADRLGLPLDSAVGATDSTPSNPADVGAGIMNTPEALDDLVDAYAGEFSVLVYVAGVGLPQPALPGHSAVAHRVADRALARGCAVVLCAIVGAALPPAERWDGVVYATSAREGIAKARALAARATPVGDGTPYPEARNDSSPTESRLVTGAPARALVGGLRVEWPRARDLGGRLDATAGEVGFPMVLKVEQLAHRVATGGLIRSVRDLTVLDAAERYLRAHFPGAPISAHEQVPHAGELIVGMVRSGEHGTLLSFGRGGTDVGDSVSFRSAPLSEGDIDDLVRPYIEGIVLTGDRNVLVRAASALVQDVVALARARPDILSLDLNPVAITDDGRLVALDCKLEIAG